VVATTSKIHEAARTLGRIAWSRFASRGPLILSHLVTGRCNCRCATCLWRDPQAEELSLDEIVRLYRDARRSGFLLNSIWGGEPLMRDDLPQIVRASKANRLQTIVITNGWFLADRLDELAPGVDCFIVSIDAAGPKDRPGTRHDEMRRLKGLFDRACAGIVEVRRRHPRIKVIVNSVLSRLNAGEAPELVRLARDLGASIYISPIDTSYRTGPEDEPSKEPLALPPDELSDVLEKILALKRRGWPINNSPQYLRTFIGGKKPYVCGSPVMCVTVATNGDVFGCFMPGGRFGSLRERSLPEILRLPHVRRMRRPRRCSICNNADIIDASYVWSLRPGPLFEYVRMYVT
jgi:MoaA/NifB/PqqE/SkfB family radical SAM enzyme